MTVVRAADMDLSDRDVARAGRLFGIERLEKIGGFENALFRSLEPAGRILRLTHTSRRSSEMVVAEFEFMAHLASHGVPAAAPIPSQKGQLVETLETEAGDSLVVAAMTEAPGGHRRSSDWTTGDIERYGALLGSMHRAAATFAPTGLPRPPWTDPIFDVGVAEAAESDPPLFQRWVEVRAAAEAHPAGGADLVIHQDAHLGNIFITDDGGLTIFDFDDLAYGTATHDVAIALFYWVAFGSAGDPVVETKRFLPLFLTGYHPHTSLPSEWEEGADAFLSYREIDLYWLLATEDPGDASPTEERFMVGRRERILAGTPLLGTPLGELI